MSQPSNTDLTVAFSGASVFANRFTITVNPIGVRIAMMEQGVAADMAPQFRGAFMMSREDAKELVKLLSELLIRTETPAAGVQPN